MSGKGDQITALTLRKNIWPIVLVICSTIAFVFMQDAFGGKRNNKPPKAQGDFTDHLTTYDTMRWMKADGWKNGSPFDNAWLADHIGFSDGYMDIRLDDQASRGEPYSSGNYQTNGFYGYGCYEASFKPVANSGVVSSFFTFAGPFDNGGNGKVNEIDVEFLGYDTRLFQANYWTNDDNYTRGHEHIIYLGFDASQEFHRYGFKWTSGGIEWFVDGTPVYEVFDTPSDPTPKANESLQKIMMNMWPVDNTAATWAGTFTYPGSALHGIYDWVRHTAGEDCTIGDAPMPPPPPPDGDPMDIHIQDIAMSLNRRGTQVITRVVISNGLGEPVSAVTIDGVWAGIITNGDTRRTTDSNGIATFYSARSRDSGDVSFCITGIFGSGMTYDETANVEACDSISK
jgi:beta-glucanase (GH16 family)